MKIALFGGTFDPCHAAHAGIVAELLGSGAADRVVVLPTVVSYHRKGKPPAVLSEGERLSVLREYFRDDDRIVVDGAEYSVPKSERGARRYVDSLRDARTRYRGAFGPDEPEWLTVIGGDSLDAFRTWTRWEEILEMSRLVVFARPGSADPTASGLPIERTLSLPEECSQVSASEIRRKLSRSPDPVGECIAAAAEWRKGRAAE